MSSLVASRGFQDAVWAIHLSSARNLGPSAPDFAGEPVCTAVLFQGTTLSPWPAIEGGRIEN